MSKMAIGGAIATGTVPVLGLLFLYSIQMNNGYAPVFVLFIGMFVGAGALGYIAKAIL